MRRIGISAITLAIGLVILYRSGREYLLIERSAAWPVVKGEVISARAAERYLAGPGDLRREVNITSRYRLGDEGRVTTTRVSLDDGASSEASVEALLSRYHEGAEVTLFVNPANPDLALIEEFRQAQKPYVALLGGAFIALVSLGALAAGARAFLREQRAALAGDLEPPGAREESGTR